MAETDIKAQVIEIFQACRMTPGTAFDEKSFLQFLYDPPLEMGKARNSFKALKTLNRFLHQIEESFGIAFTNSEWEKNRSLDALCEAIGKKHSNPKAHLNFIEKRCLQSRREVYGLPLMMLILVLFPIVTLLYKTGVPLWLALGLGALPLGALTWFNIGHYRHYKSVRTAFFLRFPDLKK